MSVNGWDEGSKIIYIICRPTFFGWKVLIRFMHVVKHMQLSVLFTLVNSGCTFFLTSSSSPVDIDAHISIDIDP